MKQQKGVSTKQLAEKVAIVLVCEKNGCKKAMIPTVCEKNGCKKEMITTVCEKKGCKKEPRKSAQSPLPDVRDRGYAWLIIALMFVSNAATAGYIRGFGVFYNEIARAYPGTSEAAGGVVMALLAGCRSMMALGVGALAVTFGARPVMLAGVALCSSGLLLSVFCGSVAQLAITLGAMMGIGICAIETCQLHILSDYFDKKKELANSSRVTGNPLGGASMPFLLNFLFDYFGLRMTYIVLSCLFLQLSILICLMRPYKVHQKIIHVKRFQKLSDDPALKSHQFEMVDLNENKIGVEQVEEKAKTMDLSLLTQPLYITHLAMITGISVALPQINYFIPRFGESLSLTKTQISAIMAYLSILDIGGRFTIGLLLNNKLFKKTKCLSTCLMISGLGVCLLPFSWDAVSCLPGVTVFSLGSCGYFAVVNVILIDQFGRVNVSSSWGFICMLQGLLTFVYPPVLGYLRDVTGGFLATFLTMGGGMVMGGLMIALQPCVLRASGNPMVLL